MQMLKRYIVVFLLLMMVLLPPGNVALAEDVTGSNEPGSFHLSPQTKSVEIASDRLIVKYKDDTRKLVKSTEKPVEYGLQVVKSFDSGAQLFKVPAAMNVEEVKAQLETSGQVEYVEYDRKVKPFARFPSDTYFKQQWALLNTGQKINDVRGYPGVDISALAAWQITRGIPNVIVAVIDTGVDTDHPELSGQFWVNRSEIPANGIDDDNNGYIDDVNGYDFFNSENTVYDPVDYDLHGTYLSGIIAGKANNSNGIAGIAPGVKIMPLKFIGGPEQEGSISGAIEAIEYAKRMGAKVCNLSWGGSEYSQALRDTIAGCPEMLFIAAAGNEGVNIDSQPVYPASFDCPNLISVAAIDNQGKKPEWSNFGPRSVQIAAPGMDIIGIVDWPEPQPDEYLYGGGTSAAAPHVTAVAALLMSKYPDISIADVKKSIITSAKPIPGLKEYTQTGGMVDALTALVTGGFLHLGEVIQDWGIK